MDALITALKFYGFFGVVFAITACGSDFYVYGRRMNKFVTFLAIAPIWPWAMYRWLKQAWEGK